MKKITMLCTAAIFALFLTACGEDKSTKESASEKAKTTEENTDSKESKYPFPESSSTGDANIVVSTPSGDSTDGNVPVVFSSSDDMLIQIGLDLENFQGDKQTFIYIDKVFSNTEQAGELTQTSLNLSEDSLKVGEHTVTAVQFENDDPEAGKVINYKEAKYEVKEEK